MNGLTALRVIVDVLLVGAFLLVCFDAFRVWLGGERGYLRWPRALTREKGFSTWPFAGLALQVEIVRRLFADSRSGNADDDQVAPGGSLLGFFTRLVLAGAVLGLIVVADWSLKSLGG